MGALSGPDSEDMNSQPWPPLLLGLPYRLMGQIHTPARLRFWVLHTAPACASRLFFFVQFFGSLDVQGSNPLTLLFPCSMENSWTWGMWRRRFVCGATYHMAVLIWPWPCWHSSLDQGSPLMEMELYWENCSFTRKAWFAQQNCASTGRCGLRDEATSVCCWERKFPGIYHLISVSQDINDSSGHLGSMLADTFLLIHLPEVCYKDPLR